MCAALLLENHPGTRYHREIINHPHHYHQLTSSNSSSRSLLLVLVADAAAGCDGGGDGHLYVAVVLVVKFYLVNTWYQINGFCDDVHHFTVKAIYQAYYCTIMGLTLCIRFNKFMLINPTPYCPFSRLERGVYFRGVHWNQLNIKKKLKSSSNPSPPFFFTMTIIWSVIVVGLDWRVNITCVLPVQQQFEVNCLIVFMLH